MAAGAAVVAAARRPELVRSLTLTGPFVRDMMPTWAMAAIFGSLLGGPWRAAIWNWYMRKAFPTRVPPDQADETLRRNRNLAEFGRFDAFRRMAIGSKTASAERLADVKAPVLVVMETRDPDIPHPAKEAQSVANTLGGKLLMIDGAGHYPQADSPDVFAAELVAFFGAVDGGERSTAVHASQTWPGPSRHHRRGSGACRRVGSENVTLANLAERLNVRPPSLYNHIAGTEELHARLALLGVWTRHSEIARAAIGMNGVEGIIAVGDAYRRFAKLRPGLYRATLSAPKPIDVELISVSSEVLEVMRAVMLPLQLRRDKVIHAVRALRSLMHGFVCLEAVHGFGLPQDIDESFYFMLVAFLRAFVTDRIGAIPGKRTGLLLRCAVVNNGARRSRR